MKIAMVVFLVGLGSAFAHPPQNFNYAKKMVYALFRGHESTLYCQCRYNQNKTIDLKICGMEPAKNLKRADRVEIEHMMPVENLGRHFKCWQARLCKNSKGKVYRGRRCCRRISPEFRAAEAELYNLWPVVGLMNQIRSNHRYSPTEGFTNTYGCIFKVDRGLRKVEPNDSAKGIVARANLFMSEKYNISLSQSQRHLFEVWSKQFPPSEWEKEWAHKIELIEGYENPYIKNTSGQ